MNDKLLLKNVIGKASKNERRQFAEWLKLSPENIDTFARAKSKFVFSGMSNEVLKQKRRWLPTIAYSVACLFIPLLAATVYLYVSKQQIIKDYAEISDKAELMISQNESSVIYESNPGTRSSIILPDSSVVRLNSGSKLITSKFFDAKNREVTLLGEGYFEVTHHENWPMLIHTSGNVVVEVLGTTFNLSAYEDDEEVKLTLIEGKVIMTGENRKKTIEIKPNQEISVDNTLFLESEASQDFSLPEVKEANINLATAWLRGNLVFDNTPMSEVVRKLERWYGVEIIVTNEKVKGYRLTASFSTESITRVMDLIKFSLMCDYEINGQQIYIR